MLRLSFVCLAGCLAQALPTGCPLQLFGPTEPGPTDTTPRAAIPTSAGSNAPEIAAKGMEIELFAIASSNVDGNISFSWVQVAGAGAKIHNANSARATFIVPSVPTDQTLRFMVTTSNGAGEVGSASLEVRIAADPAIAPDAPPAARAGPDQTAAPGTPVTLNGQASTGLGLTYAWAQVGGPQTVSLATPSAVSASFTAPGFDASTDNRYTFELTVTDSKGRTGKDQVVVTVRNPSAKTRVRVVLDMPPGVNAGTPTSNGRKEGTFLMELEDAKAPNTVANILRYVDENFYEGLIVHRVEADFVVQMGGYTSTLSEKPTRDPIGLESTGLSNVRGSVAMARTNDPNSATSQFYINLKDNSSGLDPKPGFDGYTVFGTVIEGMDVIDAIAAVRVVNKGLPPNVFNNVPLEDIFITDVRRE